MNFSIIIPAYNAAGHIRRALDSIKAQTYTDYELIVVCDSCTDDTADIAASYGARVINVNYHRDGLTRNAGIDAARGEWLLFMDDDDWWLHEFVLQQLANVVGTHCEDILRFSFIWRGQGYAKCGEWIAVWNKAWRRDFIGDTRFSDVKWWSDVDFNREMMDKHPLIADWDMPLYYYNYMRKGSISWMNEHQNT